MTKRICVVTGTRAEYGLLRWVMEGIRQSPVLELQLIATGMHLSPEFGLTVEAIEADGFQVDRKVEMLLSSDTRVGVTKSMGLGMIGFADALAELQPDLLLVLGDRYEIFSATTSAMIARVPIAHLHGGETTQGAIDEAIRHSISKMSHLHFVAAEEYRRRVIQLGEQPKHVFQVGGLGIDNILRLQLLARDELEAKLDFKLASRNLLITFHPVTLEHNTSAAQMDELLAALAELQDTGLVFTMPNADVEGRVLFRQIEDYCSRHKNAQAYTSLGQLLYLSCIKHFDGVVGNSSSGLAEVPSFNKGTINIGDRQRGRLRAASVIDCEPDQASIGAALCQLFSPKFQAQLPRVKNPYGNGGASAAIVKVLEQRSLNDLLKKRFYDLPNP
ncbi:UDP-N-acetyl-D-glucosamine 2-epimerase, UDP-hydrolysing [Thiorhodococcus drewsii AZ1]|uniref:UDP-N-acetyl-D-glucosamine 2-epimerase, UDP-hydrolysing n=1 Tax=Thiorhodococcus drewsii AZ1 TaxID=765913 RepID=G2E7F1_9GAMM|nr:UDP-N-acetylglucosamine 2-epimerase [Thiorhodococcus drewsii]EGV27990.1 UDP-N-acetyl-D-glucosamine 2-epimerase, UDP-hydrolysing [Thiorhodococcus drewsii AZ1]